MKLRAQRAAPATFRPAIATCLLFAAIGALGGCGPGGDSDAAQPAAEYIVSDSLGVEVVRNGAVGAWGAAPAALQERVRIGVFEGDDAYQFHEVLSLAVADDGTIFVGNNQTASVRVFTPEGRFLRELGGRGAGPGEYNMVNRVWLTRDGVAITDWQRGGRTGLYDRAGNLTAFLSALQPDGSTIMPLAETPAGWYATHSAPSPPPDLPPGTRLERERRIHHFDPDRNELGEVAFPLPPSVFYISPETHGLDRSLFEPERPHAFDDAGRLYIAHGEPYRIDVHDPAGTLVRTISRKTEPVPIRDVDLQRVREMIAARYDTMTPRPGRDPRAERDRVTARVQRQRNFDPRPTLPPTGRLLVSHDGSLWIERVDNAAPATLVEERLFAMFAGVRRNSTWDLFDADGRFLAAVELHPDFRAHAVRGLEVTGVLKDDLDVEYVVTYRASPPGG
jgi:hypothetical protein